MGEGKLVIIRCLWWGKLPVAFPLLLGNHQAILKHPQAD